MTNPDLVSNATIQTFTGEMFDVFNPDPNLIHVKDIAHALSMICRFGGHTRKFYSVAEHTVLLARHFEEQGEFYFARVALLHDATEAYVGDLVRPIKLQMPEYVACEKNLMAVLFRKFGLPELTPDEVKLADLQICNDEREALMWERPWSIDEVGTLGLEIFGWSPTEAEHNWLDTFWRLFT